MSLSPDVSRHDPSKATSKAITRRSRNSPFGGMNMTHAQINRAPNRRSEAAVKRSTRMQKHSQDGDQKKSNQDTFHALKMQRALSIVSYGHRNSVKTRIADVESFDLFPLLPAVKESIATQALPGLEEITPSPIQRMSIPALLGLDDRLRYSSRAQGSGMKQFLVAAETGSGKTLAYLLPILDAIKRAEAIEKEEEARENAEVERKTKQDPFYVEPPPLHDRPHPTSGKPRAIILLPSSELVAQVSAVVRSLSFKVKIRSDGISASVAPHVIRRRVFAPSGIDVLISTPHLLSAITASDPNVLSGVKHLVIDEADSLLDRSFAPTTSTIIDKSTPSLEQLILCSATIPRSLDNFLRERFPDIRRLVTPNLHAIPRRVQLGVVDIERDPYRGNRNLACADTIYSIGKHRMEYAPGEQPGPFDIKRLLVFVNEREKTQEVAEYLQSKGIEAVALHRDTADERRSALLRDFTTQPVRAEPGAAPGSRLSMGTASFTSAPKRSLPNTKVLVTTDLGSRGIDTLAVRHVILYDVPHSTIDFIHRLGRTGRMGRRGRGVVLVGKHDRRDVVREVREGMFRGQALI